MLENPSDTVGRRYAPPSQRNRALNRKKSGDRFERINHSFGNEGDKSLVTSSSNIPVVDHGDAGSSNFHNESPPGLISIDGCCSSQAAQLMSDRWAVAMHSYNDTSIDLSERPVIYSGASSSAWGHSKLPHQFDFLAELRRAMRNANLSTTQVADVTHLLQQPAGKKVHDDPTNAPVDGLTQWPLRHLEELLEELIAIARVTKGKKQMQIDLTPFRGPEEF